MAASNSCYPETQDNFKSLSNAKSESEESITDMSSHEGQTKESLQIPSINSLSVVEENSGDSKQGHVLQSPPDGGYWAWAGSKFALDMFASRFLNRGLIVSSGWRTSSTHEYLVICYILFRNLSRTES